MMKLILCCALVALASASYDRCKYNGQFLPNDYDECSYFRCDYGDEPWYDEYGNVKFVEVPMKCAYGTSTNTYKFDAYNPCGEISYKCKAPKYQSYKPHNSYHQTATGYHPRVAVYQPHNVDYQPHGSSQSYSSYQPHAAASYPPHGSSYQAPHSPHYPTYRPQHWSE